MTRNLLSVCCLSETVAVALIGAERLEMPEGPLRDILTRILADEVGHARLGWRWLADHQQRLDAERRERPGPLPGRRVRAPAKAHELARPGPAVEVDRPSGSVTEEPPGRSSTPPSRRSVVPCLEA
ncbi:MAG: hypothetical protein R3F43_31265 [bacterium]